MQVMPFWVKLIGWPDDSLFDLRTNLRYGCTILRHYLTSKRATLRARSALQRQPREAGIPEHGTRCLAEPVELPEAAATAPAGSLIVGRFPHAGQHALHPAHEFAHAATGKLFIIFCDCSN